MVIIDWLNHSATPWTVVHQAPMSIGSPRQEYWSGLPFPPPGYLPNPRIKHLSSELAGRFFTTESPRKPQGWCYLRSFLMMLSDTEPFPWKLKFPTKSVPLLRFSHLSENRVLISLQLLINWNQFPFDYPCVTSLWELFSHTYYEHFNRMLKKIIEEIQKTAIGNMEGVETVFTSIRRICWGNAGLQKSRRSRLRTLSFLDFCLTLTPHILSTSKSCCLMYLKYVYGHHLLC